MRNKRLALQKNKDNRSFQAGFSLIELMIALAIMSIVGVLSSQTYTFVKSLSRNIEATASSQEETILWMTSIRKYFYLSLYDKLAPPSIPTITRTELDIAGNSSVKYEIRLVNASDIPTTLFTITNRCVDVPPSMTKVLPKMDSAYLVGIMQGLKAFAGCETDLTPLDCRAGQSIFAEFSGANASLHYFPVMPKQGSSWSNASGSAVVGMVCIIKTTYDYTFVQMMFGTIDQRHQKDQIRDKAIHWDIRKMILPPPSNGNSQYVR